MVISDEHELVQQERRIAEPREWTPPRPAQHAHHATRLRLHTREPPGHPPRLIRHGRGKHDTSAWHSQMSAHTAVANAVRAQLAYTNT